MNCPFRYKRRTKFSFGVASDFLDYWQDKEDREESEFNIKYPTCWDKFLYWLGYK